MTPAKKPSHCDLPLICRICNITLHGQKSRKDGICGMCKRREDE